MISPVVALLLTGAAAWPWASQSDFEACVSKAVCYKSELYAFPNAANYSQSLGLYNLDISLAPSALAYPTSAKEVSELVKCAAAAEVAVQAVSGGHSFANFGEFHRDLFHGRPPLTASRDRFGRQQWQS
jgi:hypothetical protein